VGPGEVDYSVSVQHHERSSIFTFACSFFLLFVLFLVLHFVVLLLFFLLLFYIPLISFCHISNYALVRNVGTEVVHRSVRKGLGQNVKKSDILTLEEEQVVLKSPGADIFLPHNLNSRMGYFLCRNFFIHGQNELRATNANQF
jgi:hypothetical protein